MNYQLRFRTVDKDIFEAIKNGRKNVETRAATARYKNIKKGDALTLVCGKDKFQKIIKTVKTFKTIRALLKKYKPSEINPNLKSAKELEEMYNSFPGYREKIKKSGLIALELG